MAKVQTTERSAHPKITTWEGGTVRYDSKGRAVYTIRRQIGGRRWKRTLNMSPRRATRSGRR